MSVEAARIECRTVSYRSGFIEVIPNIHPDCVNLELWNINPEKAPPGCDIRDDPFPEDAVSASVELELSLAEARQLISVLEAAIAEVEHPSGA